MLNHQTMEKLAQMKLSGILDGFKEQIDNPAFSDLAFEDRLGLLVDREYLLRDNRRLTRRFQEAHLKVKASVEDVDFQAPRGLDKRLFLELASCGWIGRKHNLIITGPTGGGKTYLACALAQKACRERIRAFTTISRSCSRISVSAGPKGRNGSLPENSRQETCLSSTIGSGSRSAPK